MLRLLVPLIVAVAPVVAAADTPSTLSTSPWWEKITVTMSGDGDAQGCRYESSTHPPQQTECSVEDSGKASVHASSTSKQELTQLTFERRFHPGAMPPVDGRLETGDTLLGRKVMALAIDAGGKVSGCRIVARSGDMSPDYGCEEATAERFTASATPSASQTVQGFMTILIYGHSEHVV